MGPDGPKWGQEVDFLANPDLADILGRMDLDFENFYFWDFWGSKNLDLLTSKNLDFLTSQNLAGWTCSNTPPRWLRGGSAALPDHKVREIQGTRTIP